MRQQLTPMRCRSLRSHLQTVFVLGWQIHQILEYSAEPIFPLYPFTNWLLTFIPKSGTIILFSRLHVRFFALLSWLCVTRQIHRGSYRTSDQRVYLVRHNCTRSNDGGADGNKNHRQYWPCHWRLPFQTQRGLGLASTKHAVHSTAGEWDARGRSSELAGNCSKGYAQLGAWPS